MFSIKSVHHDYEPHWRTIKRGINNLLLIVTKGTCLYDINGQEVRVAKGEVLYIPHGIPRFGTSIPDDPHQKYTVLFTLTPGEFTTPMLQSKHICKMKIGSMENFKLRFHYLLEQWLTKPPYYAEMCNSILTELLITASREYENRTLPPHKQQIAGKIETYLLNHYREPLTIATLAGLIGRSSNYTIVLFREATGLSPLEYMHHLRVGEACRLLSDTEITVADIADHLGYCSSSHFNRAFKRIKGVTPSGFRLKSSSISD